MVVTVAAANEYTYRGLDRLEEQLPVLQQLIEKVTPLVSRLFLEQDERLWALHFL